MKKYQVIIKNDREGLEAEVNTFLDVGWQLQGGVAIFLLGNSPRFYQAMVFEKDLPNEYTVRAR